MSSCSLDLIRSRSHQPITESLERLSRRESPEAEHDLRLTDIQRRVEEILGAPSRARAKPEMIAGQQDERPTAAGVEKLWQAQLKELSRVVADFPIGASAISRT